MRGALDVNEHQPQKLVDMVIAEVPPPARVTVLGVAFKPGTDDIRESPTLRVVPALLEHGYEVILHDPIALGPAEAEFGSSVGYEQDLDSALDAADAVVLVTSWPEYASLAKRLGDNTPLVADGRRFLDADDYPRYRGIGFPA